MAKKLSIILIVIITSSVVSGCGEDNSTNSTEKNGLNGTWKRIPSSKNRTFIYINLPEVEYYYKLNHNCFFYTGTSHVDKIIEENNYYQLIDQHTIEVENQPFHKIDTLEYKIEGDELIEEPKDDARWYKRSNATRSSIKSNLCESN